MAKSDTPVPAKKKVATPKKGTDTPVVEPKGDPAPSSSDTDKKVAELEGQVETLTNQLKKQEEITKTSQRKEAIEKKEREKLEERLDKIRKGEISADEEPNLEDKDMESARKDVKIGVQGLLLDNPEFRKLLRENLTLKEVVMRNPLALLDEGEAYDVEDAVNQIKEKLEEGVRNMKTQPTSKTKKKKKKGEGPEFEPGAIQPGEGAPTPAKTKQPGGPSVMDKITSDIEKQIK